MLAYFDDDEYVKKLQDCMEQFLRLIEKSKHEIWDKSATSRLTEMVQNAYFAVH